MRVALVTTEYVSEYRDGGGLGNYLARLCRVLVDRGHEPEVFVTADRGEVVTIDGVTVHRVDWAGWRSRFGRLSRAARYLPRGGWAAEVSAPILARAVALGQALRRRERAVRFAFVQSADYQASGLFVPKRRGRLHLVRSSGPSDVWGADRWQFFWERLAMRHADRVYAPSLFVANHLRSAHRIDAAVVRPPFFLDVQPAVESRFVVPARYLIHFGYIGPNKGSDFIAQALPLAWQQDPSLRMVWAGRSRVDLDEWRCRWGRFSENVTYVGAVEKPDLYRLVAGAVASVLPSKIDNLPNTAIESLMLDVPVVGTRGSSLDEIVADGANGRLVNHGDTEALAEAMLATWRHPTGRTGLAAASPIWPAMQPDAAVAALLRLAQGAAPRTGAPGPTP